MTAASPDLRLRRLASPKKEWRGSAPVGATDHAGDRVFVTLLSLNFMLLAFFVVLGTAASIDQTRAKTVAQNVRVAFSGEDSEPETIKARLSARQALQAGVSEALASVLPALRRFSVDNSDRVDVDLPVTLFTEASAAAERTNVYDGVAHLLETAPTGYRYVLLLRGGDATSPAGLAAFDFAMALMDRGIDRQNLLVAPGTADDTRVMLSFLMFEGEGEDAPAWSPTLLDTPVGVQP